MAQRTGIIFIIDTLWPGGAEHVLLNLARELVTSDKYRPIVVCLKEAGPFAQTFQAAGIEVHSSLLTDRYDIKVIPRLIRLMEDRNVRIAVAVGSGGNRMFWATLAAKIIGVKVVVWSHTYSQPEHPEFERVNRVLYPLVDRFVALGERHRSCLAWRDKVPEGKIATIPNGITINQNDNPHWRDRARSILGLADENILAVGMIANFRRSKRHDLFIESAKRIVQHNRNVHFYIIGDGPNRTLIRNWAEQSGLLGQYLSMLGHRDDVELLLPGLDLVCICSEFQECLSLVALQAMCAGVPVLSNFIGSMDEIITDNETGFFYPELTVEALTDRMLELFADAALRRKVADKGKKLVRSQFTRKHMADHFISMFDQLLEMHLRRTGELSILNLLPSQLSSATPAKSCVPGEIRIH